MAVPMAQNRLAIAIDWDHTITAKHFFKVMAWSFCPSVNRSKVRVDECKALEIWCSGNNVSLSLPAEWRSNEGVGECVLFQSALDYFESQNKATQLIREFFMGGEGRIKMLEAWFKKSSMKCSLTVITAGYATTVERAIKIALPEFVPFFTGRVFDVQQGQQLALLSQPAARKVVLMRQLEPAAKKVLLVDDSYRNEKPDIGIMQQADALAYANLNYESGGLSERHLKEIDAMIAEVSPSWSVEQAVKLGAVLPERFASWPRISPEQAASVQLALGKLNRRELQCPHGLCVVQSKSHHAYFALFRSDRTNERGVIDVAASPGMAASPEFIVVLDRPMRAQYGMRCARVADGVTVQAIHSNGLIYDWNQRHQDQTLECGDIIVELNGLRGGSQILAEMDKIGKMQMLVRKVKTPQKLECPGEQSRRTFSVVLDHSSGASYGVKISADGSKARIREVNPAGLFTIWNQIPQNVKIEVGDALLEVNGVKGSGSALVEELQKNEVMRILVERPS